MKLKALLNRVSVLLLCGSEETDISGMAYSSKAVEPGFLFAALKGDKTDGFDFIGEAISNGATAVLSKRPKPEGFGAVWVQVFDAREALAYCAANFYGHPSDRMKVIGITGTKGKTTTTYLLEEIFNKAGWVPGVVGTIDYRWPGFRLKAGRTTPEAPDLQRILKEMADRGVTHCLIEVSSHSLDLKRVWGIDFDIAVFTNLSGEHLDYHESMENYFEAKKKLFFLDHKRNTAVINSDDFWGKRLLSELPMSTISYGLEPAAIVRGEKFKITDEGIEVLIKYPGGQKTVTSALLGKHNLYNILSAAAISLSLNVPCPAIKEGIASLRGVPGRFEKIENRRGLQIIVDYAHTDDSLRNVLETIRDLRSNRIILAFGAGGDRDKSKRERMGEVAGRLADWTILTSDNPRSEDPLEIIAAIEKGLQKTGSKKYEIQPDRREAIRRALVLGKRGDSILIAGKGHEDYQILKEMTIPFSDAAVIREILEEMGAD
jgi:UDP-N-acetylmuramoyl-L-alanyl-D-glutamate--2,6-diaminopimelate ligase